METFLATLSPMLVTMLCMLTGFVLKKSGAAPANTGAALSKLETCVLVPALVINTFSQYCTIESITHDYSLLLYCFAGVAVAIPMAFLLAKFFGGKGYEKKVYQYGFLCANYGYMGDAIVPQILGPEALYPYLLFTMPMKLLVYGWWVNILKPEGAQKGGVLRSMCNPIVIGVGIGMVLGLSGVGQILPAFITKTIGSLASCMGPLAMVLTGFVVGEFHIPQLLKGTKAYVATIFRLLVIPAVVIGVLWLLGAPELVLLMCLFAYGTPVGLNVVVFPTAYGQETEPGASLVLISHVFCVLTIPALFAVLQMIL